MRLDAIFRAIEAGATIVTANNRLARTLKERDVARRVEVGARAWAAPAILSWNGFLNVLWETRLYTMDAPPPPVRLSRFQERVLWESMIQESDAAEELLEIGATAEMARKAWEQAVAWRLTLTEITAWGGEDSCQFVGWARGLKKLCDSSHWLEEARVPDYLAPFLASLTLPDQILCAGFDEFTPQQEAFFDACREAGSVVDVFQPPVPELRSACRVGYPDGEQELLAAAAWARQLLERGKRDIGVIVPDLNSRRNDVERALLSILSPGALLPGAAQRPDLFNISAGARLVDHRLVHLALHLLQLDPDENDWQKISHVLLSKSIAGAEVEATSRASLDAYMRRKSGVLIRTDDLAGEACERFRCRILAKAVGAWRSLRTSVPAAQDPSGWCRTFTELLDSWGWPGEHTPDSTEFQMLKAWGNLLSELSRLDSVSGSVSFRMALDWLFAFAADTEHQPEGQPAPVQILGTLEAAGQQFEHLWVAGLHDEAWPGRTSANPFLPLGLQAVRRMPRSSPARELEFTCRVTDRLLASAPEVIVSYPLNLKDEALLPSPLIAGLTECLPGEIGPSPLSFARDIFHQADLDTLTDASGPPLTGDIARGGSTLFQLQAACPFRAFLEIRLGAREMEAPEPGLDPRQRGTLVHYVMKELWDQLGSQARLRMMSDSEREAAVLTAVDKAMERENNVPERFAGLERGRLQRLIGNWLDKELERAPFQVIEREVEREVDVAGVHCRLRIDRIDRLADGRHVIVDYKTGKVSASQWEGDRPEQPQLPLYAVTHEGPVAGVLFARVKAGELAYIGSVAEGAPVGAGKICGWETQMSEWQATLGTLAAEFLSGHAPVTPKHPVKTCSNCHLAAVCRVSATARTLEEGE